MRYLLFNYPNCQKCEELKTHLRSVGLETEEFLLTQKESKLKIRDYLSCLKRDHTGGIIMPTLIIENEGDVMGVVNDREEFADWLRSRG